MDEDAAVAEGAVVVAPVKQPKFLPYQCANSRCMRDLNIEIGGAFVCIYCSHTRIHKKRLPGSSTTYLAR